MPSNRSLKLDLVQAYKISHGFDNADYFSRKYL